MSAMARPQWSYVHNGDALIPCDDGDISITSLDSVHGVDTLEESGEQVIQASFLGCAKRKQYVSKEMSFAAPHAIYQEGHNLLDEVKEVVMDSGSTTTLTSSSHNCENCVPINIKILLAKKNQTMDAKFKCTKAYYFRNRSGTLQKITTSAYIVPDLQTDLIGCKNLTKQGYRIILDEDPDISGVYQKGPNEDYPRELSFGFHEHEDLYVLVTYCSSDAFTLSSGYTTWHQRLAHTELRAIKKSIPFTIGLESLKDRKVDGHVCPDCMVGKAQRNPLPGISTKDYEPMEQVHWDLVTATTPSLEGYNYALLLVDKATRYRWVYGMKTKDETFDMIRKWWADTSRVRARYPLLSLMRDNANENRIPELRKFCEERGVAERYSTPYEQWQDGAAEVTIRVYGRLVRSELAGTGLPLGAWFSAMVTANDASNVTWMEATKSTPYFDLMGEKKNVTKFRRFGCEAVMYLEPDRRAKGGKFQTRGVTGVYLCMATDRNTSAHKFWDPKANKIYVTNQLKFNEERLPMKALEAQRLAVGTEVPHLFEMTPQTELFKYDTRMVSNCLLDEATIYESGDNLVVGMKNRPNQFTMVPSTRYYRDVYKRDGRWFEAEEPQEEVAYMAKRGSDELAAYFKDLKETRERQMELLRKEVEADAARMAKGPGKSCAPPVPEPPIPRIKGLPIGIDPTKPPKNFKDAMSREDAEEWRKAYDEEYQGFVDQGAFVPVYPRNGEKILGTTTRTDYKCEGDRFIKRKVRMCIRGDQQEEDEHFDRNRLYSPAIKSTEVKLLIALAAKLGKPIYKTNTKQAFLYGDMGDERILVDPPEWWHQELEEGQVLLAVKSVYGTKQAPHCWHERVSKWMCSNGYVNIKTENTLSMGYLSMTWRIFNRTLASCGSSSPSTTRSLRRLGVWIR